MRRFGKKTDVGTEKEDGRIETEDRTLRKQRNREAKRLEIKQTRRETEMGVKREPCPKPVFPQRGERFGIVGVVPLTTQ